MSRSKCCGGGTPPKIIEGRHVDIDGAGSSQDPLVVKVTTDLDTTDNRTFNLTLTGNGELSSPWRLEVNYAATATLGDIPNVDTTNRQNGYVLQWNNAASRWEAAPPVTAAAGSVTHGNGISGDGSVAQPLAVVGDGARYIQVSASGVGLSDTAIRELVRVYANATARAAEVLPPMEGSLSVLTSEPAILWYFNGTSWVRASGVKADAVGQFLSLSGAYTGGPVTAYTRQLSFTTGATGGFTVIAAGSLTSYAGILSAFVQPVGAPEWQVGNLRSSGGALLGTAYHTDGSVYVTTPLLGVLTAMLY